MTASLPEPAGDRSASDTVLSAEGFATLLLYLADPDEISPRLATAARRVRSRAAGPGPNLST